MAVVFSDREYHRYPTPEIDFSYDREYFMIIIKCSESRGKNPLKDVKYTIRILRDQIHDFYNSLIAENNRRRATNKNDDFFIERIQLTGYEKNFICHQGGNVEVPGLLLSYCRLFLPIYKGQYTESTTRFYKISLIGDSFLALNNGWNSICSKVEKFVELEDERKLARLQPITKVNISSSVDSSCYRINMDWQHLMSGNEELFDICYHISIPKGSSIKFYDSYHKFMEKFINWDLQVKKDFEDIKKYFNGIFEKEMEHDIENYDLISSYKNYNDQEVVSMKTDFKPWFVSEDFHSFIRIIVPNSLLSFNLELEDLKNIEDIIERFKCDDENAFRIQQEREDFDAKKNEIFDSFLQ